MANTASKGGRNFECYETASAVGKASAREVEVQEGYFLFRVEWGLEEVPGKDCNFEDYSLIRRGSNPKTVRRVPHTPAADGEDYL